MNTVGGLKEHYKNAGILITGGMGFIGSNLALRLHSLGSKVTIVDNLTPTHGGNPFNIKSISKKIRVIETDICNPGVADEIVAGQHCVFNLVGQTSHTDSMDAPLGDTAANCVAPLTVLDACKRLNPQAKIVYTSTRQVYGVPKSLPVEESHPTDPVDINGCNKLAAENYHKVFRDAYGLRTTILRLTNTFGPRMRILDARQNFLGYWIGEILSGKDIPVYGDGSQLRDFNYVEDVVDCLLLCGCTDAAAGETFNLAGQQTMSLRDLAHTLCRLAGSGQARFVPFPPSRKKIDIGNYCGNASKAQRILGWHPVVPFEDGLARSLAYFRRHLAHYRPT